MKKLLHLLMVLSISVPVMGKSPLFWNDIENSKVKGLGEVSIQTKSSRLMELDLSAFSGYLLTAPQEAQHSTPLIIEIPMPNGAISRFGIVETPIIPEALKNKYPGIHTWAGQGIDNPEATVHLDVTLWGFHAMILSAEGTVFIDPYNQQTKTIYQVYYKSEAINRHPRLACGYDPADADNVISALKIKSDVQRNGGGLQVQRSNGNTLRTYDAAIACTGEYANFHGGTVPGALSAIVTSLNRVTGVYEKELSIRMVLIPNNDTLIFLNASSDPYSNNNGGTMLGQNQTTVASRIPNSGYDIGHVFSTGGGGIAGLGVICNSLQKARGVTGSPAPVNDPFDIDYVCHEMGHQFGGNHTFNGNTGSCMGNGNPSTAFEPGSGTTIMAYAGICAPQDIQNNSDAYFHTISFDEIVDYSTLSTGATCPAASATGNNPPVINSIGVDHVIPYQTPFVLEGAASDPDGDPVTYCWEEFDLGPSGSPVSPTGTAPLFRSFNPTSSPLRYFPKLSAIVSNTTSLGERLPTYARALNFRLTARDGRVNGGGVTYEEVLVHLDVINTGAPFLVTAPNTALTWVAGTSENITWDVASTNVAPVNTPDVDIFLSLDGGFTYPVTLATAVPNTGLATINVPAVSGSTCRVMVKGAGNVFFDISNTDFTITNPQGTVELSNSDNLHVYPNPADGFFNFSISGKYRGMVTIEMFDLAGRIVYRTTFDKQAEGMVQKVDTDRMNSGVYTLKMTSYTGNSYEKVIVR